MIYFRDPEKVYYTRIFTSILDSVTVPVTNFAQIFASSFDKEFGNSKINSAVVHVTSQAASIVASVKAQLKGIHAKELALLVQRVIKPTSVSKEIVSILSELACKLMPSVVKTVYRCTSFIPTSISKEFLCFLSGIIYKRLTANVGTLKWLVSVAEYLIKAIKLYKYLTVNFRVFV